MHFLPQHILEIIIIKTWGRTPPKKNQQQQQTFESFTGLKPNLNKMLIFGLTCFCYVHNKKELELHSEKGIFVDYVKQSLAYLIYFPETKAIKRVRCVKFSSLLPELSKDEQMVLSDTINIKKNFKTTKILGRKGKYLVIQSKRGKRPNFSVVEILNLVGLTIFIHFPLIILEPLAQKTQNIVFTMQKEFDSLVENNTLN